MDMGMVNNGNWHSEIETVRKRHGKDDSKADKALQDENDTKPYHWDWRTVTHSMLPEWLQDNEFLHDGHRPPLPSFSTCFKSVFRVHTETGNIWSHLLGSLAFIAVAIQFWFKPATEVTLSQKMIFSSFFGSAIMCLAMSSIFHTFSCHSEPILKLFGKFDYMGIALLIMGSFFPWLYYGFYCHQTLQVVYMTVIFILGITAIGVSLWDKFGDAQFRFLRAAVFAGFGCSGLVPAVHYLMMYGIVTAFTIGALVWLVLSAFLYLSGAVIYAYRLPERWYPGHYDIWFHSHQVFHVLVVIGAYINYHGISVLAAFRHSQQTCTFDDAYLTNSTHILQQNLNLSLTT